MQKLAMKKKYLKEAKLFGKVFCTSLKEKLKLKKEGADSIGAAGPKGEDGGDLKGDEMKGHEMKKEAPDEAEVLVGAKVRIWSDAYGKMSWGVKGTVTASAGEGKVVVQTETMGKHVVQYQHVERLDGLKQWRPALTLRNLTAELRQYLNGCCTPPPQ